MFQLLYPLGLLAALGIIIPVLIHLWNIKSGKTLKIGSVFLLGTPSNQRSRSLSVQDWPLLLLRCLLILLIAFLMGKPVYQQLLNSTEGPGWVLVKKAAFSTLWKQQRPLLDSLVKKGYEIHDFDVAFQKIELKDTLTVFSTASKNPISYFSLIRQLDSQQPQGKNIYVFSDRKLQEFLEHKPQTHLNLHWNFLPVDSNNTSWRALAYELQSGKFKQLEAKADTSGIYYVAKEVNKANAEIKLDTGTIYIQLYAEKNAPDAAYVNSAVMAVADFTKRKIELRRINGINEVSANADLVFWLSDKPLSNSEKTLLGKPKASFKYAAGQLNELSSSIRDLSGLSVKTALLHRRTTAEKDDLTPIWVDGNGLPVLSRQVIKQAVQYNFYSRFRPDWTSLVWSDQMMSFLLPIILPGAAADAGFEDKGKLLVRHEVVEFSKLSDHQVKPQIKYQEKSFSPWLWWALVLVLFIERWISYRKNLITT